MVPLDVCGLTQLIQDEHYLFTIHALVNCCSELHRSKLAQKPMFSARICRLVQLKGSLALNTFLKNAALIKNACQSCYNPHIPIQRKTVFELGYKIHDVVKGTKTPEGAIYMETL